MAQFSQRVTDITYNEILPTIVDFVNNSNILTARVMSNVKNWRGTYISQPIRIGNSTTGGSFDGLDTFSTETTNNTRSLKWYVKAYEQSIVVPGIEKAVNGAGDKAAIKLVTDRLDEAKISLTQAIGDLLYGNGVGKDFEGLGIIVDDGTVSATYGGLNRADIPGNKADVTAAASGNITLALVAAEMTAVSAAGAGKEAPTIALTTPEVWDFFESLLTATVQAKYDTVNAGGYNRVSGKTPMGRTVRSEDELHGLAGFNALTFRGRPIVADDKCPSGLFFWLNENYLDFYRLVSSDLRQVSSVPEKTEGADKEIEQPSFLQLKDFMSPINQFGEIGALIVMGNFICRAPRRQGKLTGITGASYSA